MTSRVSRLVYYEEVIRPLLNEGDYDGLSKVFELQYYRISFEFYKECLKALCEHSNEECIARFLKFTSSQEKYHERLDSSFIKNCFDRVIKNNVAAARPLFEYFGWTYVSLRNYTKDGNLDLLKLVSKTCDHALNRYGRIYLMSVAIENKHLEITDFLYTTVGYTDMEINKILGESRVDLTIYQWLHRVGITADIKVMGRIRDPHFAEWAMQAFKFKPQDVAALRPCILANAIVSNNIPMVEWCLITISDHIKSNPKYNFRFLVDMIVQELPRLPPFLVEECINKVDRAGETLDYLTRCLDKRDSLCFRVQR